MKPNLYYLIKNSNYDTLANSNKNSIYSILYSFKMNRYPWREKNTIVTP